MKIVDVAKRLAREASALDFGAPVSVVYNPLEYAWPAHRVYLERYGGGADDALLLGMNPGPFGMAQTGVPFGEVAAVRDWLGIQATIGRPANEHPKRPIDGFSCTRSEVSGKRVWGWAQERADSPDRFFRRFFVYNYCPLVFMEASGRNRTPDKLPAEERDPLYAICDRALADVVRALATPRVIGVGAFAEKRAREALGETGVEIGRILHPSPASPMANRGWAQQADRQFAAMGIDVARGW